MSRGQKPRTPRYFPRMKDRADRRRMRRMRKRYAAFRRRYIVPWQIPDDPFDLTSWANIEGLGDRS